MTYITSFGSKGDDDFQFLVPKGIAIYRRFGQLFVAESTGAQYYWIGTDFTITDISVLSTFVKFKIFMTEPSLITADIFDDMGNFVTRISDSRYFDSAGTHELMWNRRAGKFNKSFFEKNKLEPSNKFKAFKAVPKGNYSIRITAEATYSSRTYFKKINDKKFNL